MGCFRAPPPWRKTAPLKRPIERSMTFVQNSPDRGPSPKNQNLISKLPRSGPKKSVNSVFFSSLVAWAIRNAIRANRFARSIRNWNPFFYSTSSRFARITQISDSRESLEFPIRANHANQFARITPLR